MSNSIAEAQAISTYTINCVEYPRIRYGDERDDWGADRQPCHDCGAVKGQFHIPGCDVERCPIHPEYQSIACSECSDEDEDEDEPSGGE